MHPNPRKNPWGGTTVEISGAPLEATPAMDPEAGDLHQPSQAKEEEQEEAGATVAPPPDLLLVPELPSGEEQEEELITTVPPWPGGLMMEAPASGEESPSLPCLVVHLEVSTLDL